MEQMEVLLNVPTISKTTVSSTPKSTVTDDDKSFADLYEQNINESKSSNSETTQKSTAKKDESVENSAKSETKVDSKSEDETTAKTETTEENSEQGMTAVNWLSVLDMAADSYIEENIETVTEEVVVQQMVDSEQMSSTNVDSQNIQETSNEVEMKTEVEVSEESEIIEYSGSTLEDVAKNIIGVGQVDTTSKDSTVKENTEVTVAGITEETNSNENVVSTVQNEVVTQTTNVAAKQTAETTPVNTEFSTMMSDDIPQSNVQESVMTQIENSLGKIVKTGNNEVRIQLEPEHLGVLNIRIIAGKEGTQVVFKADSHQSSQLIAGQTDTLKAMLNDAGIKVDQIVVNDFSFSQENFQEQQTFEQQNGKSNKFYRGTNNSEVQLETYDAGYDLPQTVVGLNYLI